MHIRLIYISLCIQFVPFRDYIDRYGNQVLSISRLPKHVLADIHYQLLSLKKSNGIKAGPALPAVEMYN